MPMTEWWQSKRIRDQRAALINYQDNPFRLDGVITAIAHAARTWNSGFTGRLADELLPSSECIGKIKHITGPKSTEIQRCIERSK
jgi:hypothetical protein